MSAAYQQVQAGSQLERDFLRGGLVSGPLRIPDRDSPVFAGAVRRFHEMAADATLLSTVEGYKFLVDLARLIFSSGEGRHG